MTTDDTTRIHWLSKRLVGLLDDPHPGLFTWSSMLAEVAKELHELLGKKLAP